MSFRKSWIQASLASRLLLQEASDCKPLDDKLGSDATFSVVELDRRFGPPLSLALQPTSFRRWVLPTSKGRDSEAHLLRGHVAFRLHWVPQVLRGDGGDGLNVANDEHGRNRPGDALPRGQGRRRAIGGVAGVTRRGPNVAVGAGPHVDASAAGEPNNWRITAPGRHKNHHRFA